MPFAIDSVMEAIFAHPEYTTVVIHGDSAPQVIRSLRNRGSETVLDGGMSSFTINGTTIIVGTAVPRHPSLSHALWLEC